ncbi:hypothetical protein [Sciscionella marina]|uniref:hypothetical protein n=1 Tax=Sciscionella marina TaxID=508770 RepID=UPI003B8361DB
MAGRKTLALFVRATARDFVDVYELAEKFGRRTLLAEAAKIDAGFDTHVFAEMLGTLDRFDDQDLATRDVATVRTFFAQWRGELSAQPT